MAIRSTPIRGPSGVTAGSTAADTTTGAEVAMRGVHEAAVAIADAFERVLDAVV